jgi:hypothetical protein
VSYFVDANYTLCPFATIPAQEETHSDFDGINGNTKLGTLKEKYNTDSLDGVLRALRKENEK